MKALKSLTSILALSACISSYAAPYINQLEHALSKKMPTLTMDEDIKRLDTDEAYSALRMRADTDSAINYIQAIDLKKIRNLMFLNTDWVMEQATESMKINAKLNHIETLLRQIAQKN